MPLPQSQLAQLNKDLLGHEKRVASLQTTLADMSNELEAHNIILGLGRNAQVLALLQEISDQPGIASRLQQDPQGFLQTRNIHLPSGAAIEVSTSTPQSVTIAAKYQVGRFHFSAQWDSASGFSVRQL